MSDLYDIDEQLWGLYVNDCRQHDARPSIRDYLIWCDENDYERPETWDGELPDVV